MLELLELPNNYQTNMSKGVEFDLKNIVLCSFPHCMKRDDKNQLPHTMWVLSRTKLIPLIFS